MKQSEKSGPALQQDNAMKLFCNTRAKAAKNGFMTDDQIKAEIQAAREDLQKKKCK